MQSQLGLVRYFRDFTVVGDVAGFELLSTPGMGEDEGEKSGSGSCPTEARTVIGERVN